MPPPSLAHIRTSYGPSPKELFTSTAGLGPNFNFHASNITRTSEAKNGGYLRRLTSRSRLRVGAQSNDLPNGWDAQAPNDTSFHNLSQIPLRRTCTAEFVTLWVCYPWTLAVPCRRFGIISIHKLVEEHRNQSAGRTPRGMSLAEISLYIQ